MSHPGLIHVLVLTVLCIIRISLAAFRTASLGPEDKRALQSWSPFSSTSIRRAINIIQKTRTSLVVQWLRICFPMQGAWVRSLVRELRSHLPWGNWALAHHNYRACASSREPMHSRATREKSWCCKEEPLQSNIRPDSAKKDRFFFWKITSVGKDVEKLESLCTAGAKGKQSVASQKAKNGINMWSWNYTSGYILKTGFQRYICTPCYM